jgi:hypothetical protein
MLVRVSVFFHTYRCATDRLLIGNPTQSFVVPVLVVSELRPSCLPKSPFLFQKRRRFVHQENHNGRYGREKSNYGRKYVTCVVRRHRFKTIAMSSRHEVDDKRYK